MSLDGQKKKRKKKKEQLVIYQISWSSPPLFLNSRILVKGMKEATGRQSSVISYIQPKWKSFLDVRAGTLARVCVCECIYASFVM